jgi:hypothetical protein
MARPFGERFSRFKRGVPGLPADSLLRDERVAAYPATANLLARFLERVAVKVIHLEEFEPPKTKVENGRHRDRGGRVS